MAEPRRAPEPVPSLDDLVRDPERGAGLAPERARRLLLALAPVQRALELAVWRPIQVPEPATVRESEPSTSWITPEQAATIANVSRRTIYGWSRRSDWRPFCSRHSRKVLRIEEAAFRRWLNRRRAD